MSTYKSSLSLVVVCPTQTWINAVWGSIPIAGKFKQQYVYILWPVLKLMSIEQPKFSDMEYHNEGTNEPNLRN